MKEYKVELTNSARKSLRKLSPSNQLLIAGVLETLKSNPLPPRAIKLTGRPGYRIRIRDLRIIYTINAGKLTVLVLDVGHRGNIYTKS